MNVLSLFDGISCGQIALNRAGIKYDNYFASEIDKHAIKVTQHNYPNTIQLGDVTQIKASDLPKIDLLIGGSPCQGFSFIGKGLNFEDERSKLFFEFVRLLKATSPTYFLLENVKMKKEHQSIITEYLSVSPIELNSSLFSAQNRKRLYWTNISYESVFPNKSHSIESILEDSVSEEYYLTETQQSKLNLDFSWKENEIITHKGGKHQQDTIYRYDGIIGCLSASHHGAARHLTKTYMKDGRIRRLTEIECERLQSVPDNFTMGVSSSKRYEMLGNGWTVDVIAHIFKGLL